MDTNIPVLRNIRLPKLPATSICISNTHDLTQSGLYCCDAAVQNMRHTKEGNFELKGKLEYLISKANDMKALNSCFPLPQPCLIHALPT